MNRPLAKKINWFLKTLNVNISEKESSWTFSKVALGPCVTFLTTSIYAFVNRSKFDKTASIAAYAGSAVFLILITIILGYNHQTLAKILYKINTNVYTYTDENRIPVFYQWWLQDEYADKIVFSIFSLIFFGFSLSFISPIIEWLQTGTFPENMFPAWYPWKDTNIFLKTFTNIFQGITGSLCFWIYFSYQIVLLIITIEFLRQYRKLWVAVRTAKQRAMDSVVQRDKTNNSYGDISTVNYGYSDFTPAFRRIYNKNYRFRIVQCIQHFQQLHYLFNLVKPWLLPLITIELTISTTTFALVFYNLSKASKGNFIGVIGASFNVVVNLFSRCVVGEIFSELNHKVTEAIFHETEWYEVSSKNKTLLTIFHSLSQRSYKLAAFYIYPVSYYTFSGITRISYSYLNLIRTSMNNN